MTTETITAEAGRDFIRDIVQADLDSGKHSRIVTRSLVGDFWGPRPRSFSRSDSGNAASGRARPKSVAVHSGLSGSIPSAVGFLLISPDLSCVRLAQADDPDAAPGFDENQRMQTTVQHPERPGPDLAVLLAIVDEEHRGFELEIPCPIKREPSLPDVALAFLRVELDVHK